jgi:ubiquinone/menaquinone biosynthesis C-methylase UbiE
MSILVPARQYDPAVPEMIDDPNADARLLRDELKSIRTINRLFGGHAAMRRGMGILMADVKTDEISVLDLGTGSADLPVYMVKLGRRLKRRITITAVDNHQRVLEVARERTKHYSEISIHAGNLLNLNYSPGAFDIVVCSLTLHHFSREDAIHILRSMNLLCRTGFLVNDLNRSRIAAWTTKVYTNLTTRNRMTLTDSYLSVLRGFTMMEVQDMALAAGLHNVELSLQPFFRFLLICKPQLLTDSHRRKSL